MMGRSEASSATDYFPGGEAMELPAHSVTLDTYVLDKYEVTVGRFRGFVDAYNAWHVEVDPEIRTRG